MIFGKAQTLFQTINICKGAFSMVECNSRKAAIIGCGFVGATSAFALAESGLFSEIVLLDKDRDRAEGEALDLSHGLPFAKPVQIYAGHYEDVSDAAVLILTAGAGQKPGESRLSLAQRNAAVYRSILPQIVQYNRGGILLVVSNPVDLLTYAAAKLSGFPENRVFGSGTVLDTARLKYRLGEHLGVDSRSVHAFIVGEHGDSEIAVWSSANVSGIPLARFCELRGFFNHAEMMHKIARDVKDSAYTIIEKKHATYYGIAMSVKRICEAIVRDEKSILPVTSLQHGVHGIEGVALSMPAIIGRQGVEGVVPIAMNASEEAALRHSAQTLQNALARLEQDALEPAPRF